MKILPSTRRALREQLIFLLREGKLAELVVLAGQETGVADLLLQFLYDPSDVLHWRALEALGRVAGAHPAQVRKVISRLLWLLNEDSGSFGWGAAAALGEIGRQAPQLVDEIVPMFCGFLEEDFSRAPMLWGIGRMGELHPEFMGEVIPFILPCLDNPDPQVRALAAWALGKLRHREAQAAVGGLVGDASPVALYDGSDLKQTTVAQVARETVEGLAAPKSSD